MGSYGTLKKIFKGARGIEIHHLIEKRFVESLSKYGIKANDILSIPLTSELHQKFTNAWRKALPYGKSYTAKQIVKAMNSVYEDYPQILNQLKNWARGKGLK